MNLFKHHTNLSQDLLMKKDFIEDCRGFNQDLDQKVLSLSDEVKSFIPGCAPCQFVFETFVKLIKNKYRRSFPKMILSFGICILFLSTYTSVISQVPLITVRLANPVYDGSGQYCLDVEFRSNLPNQQLFGMNVRFFYPDQMLEFVGFSDFQGGYLPVFPDPPDIITSGPAGPALFNFIGAAEFVNGAIQLVNQNSAITLDTANWTKIFKICFQVDDPGLNEESFCPPIVWDLEQNPADGGYLSGDDGVVITVVDPDPTIESTAAFRNVVQFNWMYTGSGSPPYGVPTSDHCISIVCPTLLPVIPPETICENGNVVFQINSEISGTVTYSWNFGSGATPPTGLGIGPHSVTYITTTDNQVNGANVLMTITKDGCPDLTGQVSHVEVNPFPDATINGSISNLCYYTNRTFHPSAPEIPGATYLWTFGADAEPLTSYGYGPQVVYYTTAGPKTVSLVIYPNEPGAQCPDSSSITFNVTVCTANIAGTVKNINGEGIQSVDVNLYADNNYDGLPDDTILVKSVHTVLSGLYSMTAIPMGNYVIVQSQPHNWLSVDDDDVTSDGDIVPNISSLDNIIPATLHPGVTDSGNNFEEKPARGRIKGRVFVDLDSDEAPDTLEGLSNVTLSIYPDDDMDGQADTLVSVAAEITDSNGAYTFPDVDPGNYVLVEGDPMGYVSVEDIDATNDVDSVPNSDLNDNIIPVTISSGEIDDENYFMDGPECILLVSNGLDSGPGSLRNVIECATEGDIIGFANSLAGSTINITSSPIIIDKEISIISTLSPRVKISSAIPGMFRITNSVIVEFRQLDIISGLTVPGNMGAAFENYGDLVLQNVNVLRNPTLPSGQYLIRNTPSSHLLLSGNCFIEMD